MQEFQITEHIGVGPIALGADRAAVRLALADFPDSRLDQSHPRLDYAFGNSLQIEYSVGGRVQFIGVGYYTGCGCDYFFRGQHIGDYSAEALFRLLATLEGCPELPFEPDEYYFPRIRMTVYEADPQYDSRSSETTPVYGQVGVANDEYASAISAL